MMRPLSQGARFRAAVREEKPLQVVGTINAYSARLAERVGFRALYVSGGGVAARKASPCLWRSSRLILPAASRQSSKRRFSQFVWIRLNWKGCL